MEEDINILEKMIEEVKQEAISYNKYCYEIEVEQVKAIENLLKRYKELQEKETEKFLKILEDNSKTMLVKEVMELRTKLQNSIPISVIQNKIKMYEKMIEERPNDKAIIEIHIRELQELLEERNK